MDASHRSPFRALLPSIVAYLVIVPLILGQTQPVHTVVEVRNLLGQPLAGVSVRLVDLADEPMTAVVPGWLRHPIEWPSGTALVTDETGRVTLPRWVRRGGVLAEKDGAWDAWRWDQAPTPHIFLILEPRRDVRVRVESPEGGPRSDRCVQMVFAGGGETGVAWEAKCGEDGLVTVPDPRLFWRRDSPECVGPLLRKGGLSCLPAVERPSGESCLPAAEPPSGQVFSPTTPLPTELTLHAGSARTVRFEVHNADGTPGRDGLVVIAVDLEGDQHSPCDFEIVHMMSLFSNLRAVTRGGVAAVPGFPVGPRRGAVFVHDPVAWLNPIDTKLALRDPLELPDHVVVSLPPREEPGFETPSAPRFRGRVVDPSGTPIPGVALLLEESTADKLQLTQPFLLDSWETDVEGQWNSRLNLAHERAVWLMRNGYALTPLNLREWDPTQPLQVSMERTWDLHLRLRLENGDDLPPGLIVDCPQSPDSDLVQDLLFARREPNQHPSAAGWVSFRGLPTGPVEVRVRRDAESEPVIVWKTILDATKTERVLVLSDVAFQLPPR